MAPYKQLKKARPGLAWRGEAGHGEAWRGKARIINLNGETKMGVIDNKPKTFGEKIRKTRQAARTVRNSSSFYRRIKEIKEENIGKKNEKHTIILHDKWSWNEKIIISEKSFDSIHDYMVGIRETFKVTPTMILKTKNITHPQGNR